jgi:hypothetical protein
MTRRFGDGFFGKIYYLLHSNSMILKSRLQAKDKIQFSFEGYFKNTQYFITQDDFQTCFPVHF